MYSQTQTLALPAPVRMLALPSAKPTSCKTTPVIPLFSGTSQAIPLLRGDIQIEIPEAAKNNKKVTPEIMGIIENFKEVTETHLNSKEQKIKECKEDKNSNKTKKKNGETKPKTNDPSCHSADARWLKKCQIVRLLREGKMSETQIAKIIGVHRNTVVNLAADLKRNPNLTDDDLREDHRGPYENPFKKIPLEIYLSLRVILVTTLPIFFGLSYTTWSGVAIFQLLTEFCKLDVKLSYVYYFLKNTNITSKFAQRMNPSQDLNKVQQFIHQEYKKIVARSLVIGAEILFLDEVHVCCGNHVRGFAPYGEPALMSYTTAAMHSYTSYLVFVGLNGFIRIFEINGTFTAEDFKRILQQIKKENPNKKFILICDNARVHHAKHVKKWLRHYKGGKKCFELRFMPAYSPDLNPAERWNNIFKEHMRKTYCKDQKQVQEVAREFIKPYNNQEKTFQVKRLFEDKRCSYTITEIVNGQKIADRFNKIFGKTA